MCRNPLYVGTFFHAVALCLLLKSVIFAAAVVAASFIYILSVVPTEEKYLHNKLGDTYADYCRRVPRYFLRFSLYHTEETIEVQLKPLQREFWRSSLSTFWIPVAATVFSYLQNLSWWPQIPWAW